MSTNLKVTDNSTIQIDENGLACYPNEGPHDDLLITYSDGYFILELEEMGYTKASIGLSQQDARVILKWMEERTKTSEPE
jgi:hypothetical protein